MKINEKIAALRKQKGITQGELAQELGVTNQSVSKWESGQCCPDIQLLPDMARYFGVSIDELMGEEVVKKNNETDIEPKINQNTNDPLLSATIDLLGSSLLLSTSVLQRKLNVGFGKAKMLLGELQAQGYIVEVKPGFYQKARTQQEHLRLLVKNVASGSREDMLNTALAMHAAWFYKMQKADSTVDSAVEAVVGGQWGYSAISEPDITTVMRGQSVFYSKNRALDFTSERIGKLCILMKSLSDRKNLTVLAAMYELTVHAEDAYVGIDELAKKAELAAEEVGACLDEGLFPYILEKNKKYRMKGECMALLPILSILCY